MQSLFRNTSRFLNTAASQNVRKVTLFPGDGIGKEISVSLQHVFEAAKVPIEWEVYNVGAEAAAQTGVLISDEAIESVRRNKVGLKGPLGTPIGAGHRSLNVALRQNLGLYANVRPTKSIPAVKTRYDNVDLVVVRENTEGMYTGQEFRLPHGVTVGMKVITESASMRIAKYAFDFAVQNGRKKVTCVHKANIQKLTDGLFLECCRKVAAEYPQIKFEDKIIDAACMSLVQDPTKFDILVMENLYGDIVSDLTSGLIGGLGLTGSGNFGENGAMFEAVHGTAPDIAGKNLANPCALLFSGVMMLRYLNLEEHASRIEQAVFRTLENKASCTGDLGGKAKTTEFTRTVISNLDSV